MGVGCATTPYRFAEHGETPLTLALRQDEPQIERGEPNAWLDGFGHYHERYRRCPDGKWRIAEVRLTRLRNNAVDHQPSERNPRPEPFSRQ